MKEIVVRVVDKTGHTTTEKLTPQVAVQRCAEMERKGWHITVDGKFTTSDKLTASDVEKAEDMDITLVTSIGGG